MKRAMRDDLDRAGMTSGCTLQHVVDRPRQTVYDSLLRAEEWPVHLPHVLDVDMRYDDGRYQEFVMSVKSDAGLVIVRSVRKCDSPDRIEFFQPDPPAFLRHHAGGWSFEDAGPERCLVTTYQRWRLAPAVAAQMFPPTGGRTTDEQVHHLLSGHARLALTTWKAVLEERTKVKA